MKKRYNFKELNEQTIDIKLNYSLNSSGDFKKQQKRFNEIEQWIKDNDITMILGLVYATFYSEEDALLFQLRWG